MSLFFVHGQIFFCLLRYNTPCLRLKKEKIALRSLKQVVFAVD